MHERIFDHDPALRARHESERDRNETAKAKKQLNGGGFPNAKAEPPWPEPLGNDAYHGLAGDFVHLVEPQTEADPAALMFQFLAAAGNCFGNRAWITIEQTRQYPTLFVLVVGDTAKARKGTSLRWVFRMLREAEPAWESACHTSGLSTGEGLIQRVRDPVYGKDKNGAPELIDAGVQDKRLLIVEEEFSRPIRVMGRPENTLAAVLREAWDGSRLRVMTRNHALEASDTSVSIVAHVTLAELRAELTEVNLMNGFANRFLFAIATRSKELPFGGEIGDAALSEIATRFHKAIAHAPAGRIYFDEAARHRWIETYSGLSAAHPGMFGAATARSEAQTLRVALLYALLDRQPLVGLAHLNAALEIVGYANNSVRHIFGDATGNRIEDAILQALRSTPDGLTRTAINHDLFGRNVKADDIGNALARLSEAGKIYVIRHAETGGRPADVWHAT